jgi:gamma-glutamylcyclotransferase (GGCT)/AIG2-like uncharacterized protein YtfP
MSALTSDSPTPPSHVFVYGTLMTGQSRHALLAAGKIKSIVPASISGELIDLGEYPALRLSAHAKSRVAGELIEFAALDEVIEQIDNEEGPQYRREIVNVTLNDGQSRFAWAYVLASDAGHCPVIESGNWRSKTAAR